MGHADFLHFVIIMSMSLLQGYADGGVGASRPPMPTKGQKSWS